MRIFRILTPVMALACAIGAQAQPVSYATKAQKIYAGVLLIESQGYANPVPHVWSNFDADTVIKPAEWTIDSPMGQTRLTDSAFARWGGFGPPPVGSVIGKKSAPYWEVVLNNINDEQLSQFDILSLSVSTSLNFNPLERERLRRYVDKGGTLWIDLAATAGIPTVDPASSAPAPFIAQADGTAQVMNLFHPAMRFPNSLRLNDIAQMSFPGVNYSARPVVAGDLGSMATLLSRVIGDGASVDVVAASSLGRTISVGRFGDGYVVVTTRGVLKTMNRGVFTTYPVTYDDVNQGFVGSSVRRDNAFISACKFAVNVLSLSSAYSSNGAGSRKTNFMSAQVGAPAIKRWIATGAGSTKTPVLFNGRLVVSVGDQLVCYDAKPNNDLDGDIDANPDDGLVDPVGSPVDIIWVSQPLGARISSPTIVELPGAPVVEQVWCVDDNSRAYSFNLSSNGAAVAPIATVNPPVNTANEDTPGAPTFHDGVLYIADRRGDSLGRIWAINPRTASKDVAGTGSPDWALFGSGRLRKSIVSPAVGLISVLDNSGGMDVVAYVATEPDGVGNQTGLVSVWVGSKGEAPLTVNRVGNNLTFGLRASQNNVPVVTAAGQFGLRTTMIDPAGNPASTLTMQNYLTGGVIQVSNGQIQLTLTPAGAASGWDWDGTATPSTADDVKFRFDYTLDWSGASAGLTGVDSYIRGHIKVVDESAPRLRPVSSPVISQNGNVGLAVATTAGTPGGTFYNIRENGRGAFWVKSRFEFHDAITNLNVLGLGPTPYPGSIVDEDALNVMIPFLNAPITGLRPVGIAARGSVFYVTAAGVKNLSFGFPADTSVLLALKADPDPAEFQVDLGTTLLNTNIILKQGDIAKSLIKTSPTLFSTLAGVNFTVETIPNTTTARIIIKNLNSSTTGDMQSCIANNLPVTIVRNGQTETLIEPEAFANSGSVFSGRANGRYSPVYWYTVLNGYKVTTSPVVTGGTVYMAGSSVLPSLVTVGIPGITNNGLLYGLDAEISANDPHMKATINRPWVNQLWMLNNVPGPFTFGPNTTSAEAIKWPEFRGIEEFDDFRIRLLQASMADSGVNGFSAGDGAIAAAGPNSTNVFSRSDFVVVDAGRVSRFDPAGNPMWSADQTTYAGLNEPITNAQNVRKLSSPTRMYPLADSGYVVVDPGNDAVLRVDASGREVRTVKSVRIHPDSSPAGLSPNEPLQLRRPQDVIFWSTTHTSAQVATAFPSEGAYRTYTDERWDHWLIADAGNNRVIEAIDRYMLDAQGRVTGVVRYRDPHNHEGDGFTNAYGIVYWHTPEELSGKKYAYNSIARTRLALSGGGSKTVVGLGFNNVEPSLRTFGLDTNPNPRPDNPMGYGGVVIYDGGATKVITEFDVPILPANQFVTENPVGSGNYAFNSPAAPAPLKTLKVSGLNSVTMKYVDVGGTPALAVMMSLDSGIYEVVQNTVSGRWEVRWMLPNEAYIAMRRPRTALVFNTFDLRNNPRAFRAMHARRLDSGDVLVVNGYAGSLVDGSTFNGEVFLVDGTFVAAATPDGVPGYNVNRRNLGFGTLSVMFELPPVQGTRGLVSPVFAERQ